MAEEYVYHGSRSSGHKELVPKVAGFGKRLVYATDNLTLAAIFIGKGRNSWQADFDIGDDGVPYFRERVDGIFDKWYKMRSGSIYALPKSEFHREKGMWEHELASEKPVGVVEEIKIGDLKEFMLNLEKEGKLKIVYYKDFRKMFPDDDADLIKMGLDGLNKYTLEFTLKAIRKFRPDLEKRFIEAYEKRKKS